MDGLLLMVWLVSVIVGTMMGANKHAGCMSFVICALLGPIGVIIVWFMSPEAGRQSERIKCPYCAELIMPEAKICPHCKSELYEEEEEEEDK